MNCTPFVRQYGILFRKWGVFVCQRDNESTTELKEFFQIEQFRLEQSEEVLGNSIIQTSGFPGHTLRNALCLQQILVGFHLILPALIRMQNQIVNLIWQLLKSALQHIRDLFEVWMAAQIVADNFAIEQIKNWRQVEFLVVHFELGNICDPFSIWLVCLEVPFQQV